MRGPRTEQEALAWAQEAMRSHRYRLEPHFEKRCAQRGFTIMDLGRVIESATSCVAYAGGRPVAGGTCWRIYGSDAEGERTAIGVEICRDHLGKIIILITLMDAT